MSTLCAASARDRVICGELALSGSGISLLPDFFVSNDAAQGKLVPLLTRFLHIEAGIYVVRPQTKHSSVAVRVLIDFLASIAERMFKSYNR